MAKSKHSLSAIFSAVKKQGYVLPELDMYLLSLNQRDTDRAVDVNAPSQVGKCMRARYYSRIGTPVDGMIDARSRRIFDNGTGMHERIQAYLLDQGMLLMDEVPVIHEPLNIQGHTDGVLRLTPAGTEPMEAAILELKSINSNGFANLKTVRDDHKMQGLVYLYCIEGLRRHLHVFQDDLSPDSELVKRFRARYQHLKSGSKYSRDEKIEFQVSRNIALCEILKRVEVPVTKVIFLYENKDTQEIKEFVVTLGENESVMEEIIEDFEELNYAVQKGIVPERGGDSRSCYECRFCQYKVECWG